MKVSRISTLIAAAALWLVAASPAFGQGSIGPLLEENLLVSSGYEWAGRANAAYDGSHYLVVWSQWSDEATCFDIYARLVNPSGEPVTSPVSVVDTAEYDLSPGVAFNGNYFFVVSENTLSTRGRVVDGDGQPVGAQLIINPFDGQGKREPAVVWDGTKFLVVWRDYDPMLLTSAIVGQFVTVDESGNAALSGPPFALDPSSSAQFVPSVACGPGSCLVTWTRDVMSADGYDVEGILVGHYAPVSSPFTIAGGTGDQGSQLASAGIAFDGTNYLVVYDDEGGISGTRVSPDGTVLDPDGFAIAETGFEANLAFGDSEYLALWADASGPVRGARLSPDGNVLDPGGVALSVTEDDGAFPAAAFGGGDYLVTWQDASNAGISSSILAQLVGPVDLTPEEQIEELIDEVADLGGGLTGVLETALEKLTDGNASNDAAAIGKLGAFIKMIEAQEKTGRIAPEEAAALIAAAQAIIDELQGG